MSFALHCWFVFLALVAVGVVARWPELAWAGGIVVGAVGWEILRTAGRNG